MDYAALTTEQIQTALSYIDYEDRELWYTMGMAVKSELGKSGKQLWLIGHRTVARSNSRTLCHNGKVLILSEISASARLSMKRRNTALSLKKMLQKYPRLFRSNVKKCARS